MTATNPAQQTSTRTLIDRLIELIRRVPARLHPAEARALHRSGRFHRLIQWWVRPLGSVGGTATDAATRLEILSRGGFPR